jgi:Lysophospholipase L1 and related esterases
MKNILHGRRRRASQMVALALIVNLTSFFLSLSAIAGKEAGPLRIVAFGDSLTSGLGLPESEAFPGQLQKALRARGHDIEIINAGVSGDTSAAGLERIDWAVPEGTDAVILQFGSNDALRGLDPKQTRANVEAMITKLKSRGIPVLLAGSASPRGMGETYVAEFDRIFSDLARAHELIFYPFFLTGVALRPELNLEDGMHPNAKGVAAIVDAILPAVEKLLAQANAPRRGPKS